jgi:hypothetical protein
MPYIRAMRLQAPSFLGRRWIRVHEAGHALLTARATDPNLLRVVEGAVRLGNPLLLDDMPEGSLPPGLEGLLQTRHASDKRSGRSDWSSTRLLTHSAAWLSYNPSRLSFAALCLVVLKGHGHWCISTSWQGHDAGTSAGHCEVRKLIIFHRGWVLEVLLLLLGGLQGHKLSALA